jgi:branched-chain amino acid transport system substrate-binding protein
MKCFFPAFLFTLILAFTTICNAEELNEDQVVVGVMASLSGNWSSIGDMTRKGLMLASEKINNSGGLLGKKVILNFQDTDEAVSPAKVISVYQFLRSQGVTLFIGPTGSAGGIAIAPVASKDNVVMITPSVGVRDFHIAANNLFNTQGVWELSSAKLASLAYKSGIVSIAIFSSQHPYEFRQADAFEGAFRSVGGEVIIRRDPLPDLTDLRTEALKISKAKPQAIFFSNYNQMALAAKLVKQYGFKGKKFASQMDASRLIGSEDSLDQTIFGQLTGAPEADFFQEFKKKFREEPGYTADFAFDALTALAKAVADSGSLEPDVIKRVLGSLSFNGASGKVEFDKDGCIIRLPTAWRVNKDKFEFFADME